MARVRARVPAWSGALLLGLLGVALWLTGCGGPGDHPTGRAADDALAGLPVHEGPVVLVTLASLRADAVDQVLMPHLHSLAAEADWAGRAVAPSSWALPSLASLATGLGPWSHGVVGAPFSELPPELVTLAEALHRQGYVASAYVSSPWIRPDEGWAQGFGFLRELRGAARAAGHLASLGEAGSERRQLVWIDVPEPAAPYRRWDDLMDRLGPLPEGLAERLPEGLDAAQLERWADPAEPVPPERRRVLTALYRLNAAHADRRLGWLLEALRGSGVWDDTLLVVTSPNGEELGEYGSTASGVHLGRTLLEVPLVIRLPAKLRAGADPGRPVLAAPEDRPVALTRLWPTLVAAVGGPTPPAVGPSLFDAAAPPVLSELYLENGYNELSLVDSADGVTWQLLRRSSFAPPEEDFHRARRADLGGRVPGLGEPPRALFERLNRAFRSTPPMSGLAGEAPRLTLLRWVDGRAPRGGVEVVRDPERTATMDAELRRRWLAFHGCEDPLEKGCLVIP